MASKARENLENKIIRLSMLLTDLVPTRKAGGGRIKDHLLNSLRDFQSSLDRLMADVSYAELFLEKHRPNADLSDDSEEDIYG